mmetsp:Transcript_1280/g.3031  ORF Transcript_1280/g.3031 Transcript_1280/m.3031 type:complete len:87 (+) Transcript_1280:1344-1604(+)
MNERLRSFQIELNSARSTSCALLVQTNTRRLYKTQDSSRTAVHCAMHVRSNYNTTAYHFRISIIGRASLEQSIGFLARYREIDVFR